MKPTRIIWLTLVALVGTAGPAVAQDFGPSRIFIRKQIAESAVPSVAVAVTRNGKIIWEEGFGWADRERLIPATAQTMYSLASISKPFTATALMTLVQAGKIDLDRPINDYLGNAKLRARIGEARDATVRRLAGHTSGLGLHYQFFYADEPRSPPSRDESILRYGDLVRPAGEEYEYSNLGYGILDYMIARSSGVEFDSYMRQNVFLPLGLARTSVDIGPGLAAFTATRYGRDGLPLPMYAFDHPGASAIFSSAHDLARFAMFQLKDHLDDQKAILTDAAIDEMHRPVDPQATRPDKDNGYALGFGVRMRDGYKVISHNGSMGGVSTSMQLFPDKDIAVIVLSNTNTPVVRRIANYIEATLLPGWKGPPDTTKPSEIPGWKGPPETNSPSEERAEKAIPVLVGTWKGAVSTYVRDIPIELRFFSTGEAVANIGDQPPALINRTHYENGVFEGWVNAKLSTPDTDTYAYSVQLLLKLRGDALTGEASAVDIDETLPRLRNALSHWVSLRKVK